MSDVLSSQCQRSLLHDLLRLAQERAQAEQETTQARQERGERMVREHRLASQQIHERLAAEKEAAERTYRETREATATWFTTGRQAEEKEFKETQQRIRDRFEKRLERTQTERQEAIWAAGTIFEEETRKAREQHREVNEKTETAQQKVQTIRQEASRLITRWRMQRHCAGIAARPSAVRENEKPLPILMESLREAEADLLELRALVVPRWLIGYRLPLVFVVIWLLGLAPAFLFPLWYYWLAGATVAVGLLFALTRYWLGAEALAQALPIYQPLVQALGDAEAAAARACELAEARRERDLARCQQVRDQEMERVERTFRPALAEVHQRREHDERQAEEKYETAKRTRQRDHDDAERQAEETYSQLRARAEQDFEHETQQADARYARLVSESEEAYFRAWNALTERWQGGLAAARATIAHMQAEAQRWFPEWPQLGPGRVPAGKELPHGIRFGEMLLDLQQLPHGIPDDDRLRPDPPFRYVLPALVPFPGPSALLLRASDEGTQRAVQILQAVALRALTCLPAGKVRFTLIDPVDLGENFAAFMHLADVNEALVSGKIWTEARAIDQALGDVTAHIENVIQKLLRSQFSSLEEYNAQAGEVAEPYRFLVIANFPLQFTAEAARRLLRILATGPACGVYTLLSVDRRAAPPEGFRMQDLEEGSLLLTWEDGVFRWADEDFGDLPLTLDRPPDAGHFTRIVQLGAEMARQASRVEVPFEFVAPPPEQWWTRDSRAGVRVAIGRAGAIQRQYLSLGEGTAQHSLVAGKTGSGKSTLLHAIVTSAGLAYSPDELEMYLVDFKKGVEFKTYATQHLPHARVIAVESEREFGLSVLQRLDAELQQRGQRFRQAGAQDVNAFRQDGRTCPRILLIVDEFQELFVEDDKLAQEAALLLDRLVRQGRAFGIHVLLGSQTLGGAYSLARSTIDQMAIRIALQCSEADAHLILSRDNGAARLLTRPGEAIYNDANGLVEGNQIFQVVWLSEQGREHYLQRIAELARQRQLEPRPPIVFEGNLPADLGRNAQLNDLLQQPAAATAQPWQVWLGDAVAIKDPTVAVFRPQSGHNLLMVGQDDRAALGMHAAAIVSLLARQKDLGEQIFILDGTRADDPHVGWLQRIAAVAAGPIPIGGWKDAAVLLARLGEELDRRQASQEPAAPLFLIVHGLQWFRELRKPEDDFGYSRRAEEKPEPPNRLLPRLLRDGPGVGIHALVWCDSLNNLNRTFDRTVLREFELRVLLQMSAADSSNLIDSPVASKLGIHRALFHTEERAQAEKFRPYGWPSPEWLEDVRQLLSHRPAERR